MKTESFTLKPLPDLTAPGLQIKCIHCHEETYYSPPKGTDEVKISWDICTRCNYILNREV